MIEILGRLRYFLSDFYGAILGIIAITLFVIFFSFLVHKLNLPKFIKILVNLILFTFLAFCFVFLIFEGYFRYAYDESDALGFLRTNQKWLQRHVVYNNFFYRDRDFEINKKPGITRIGVVGDSLTFGYGIKDVNDRFSNILEAKLRAAGKNVEVYNLGVPGLDTCGEVEQFEKVKFIQFDIMVWEFYMNDIQPCGASTGTAIVSTADHRSDFVKSFSDKSFFFDYLYWRISSTHEKVFRELRLADLSQYSNPVAVDAEKESVASLSALLKGDDGNRKVVTIIFPSFFLIGKSYPAGFVHKMIYQMLSDNHIDKIIDLLPSVIGKKQSILIANRFDFHPSVYVHHLAAEQLYKAILPFIK